MVNGGSCSIGDVPSMALPIDPKQTHVLPTSVAASVSSMEADPSVPSPSSDDWLPPSLDRNGKRDIVMHMLAMGSPPLQILQRVFPNVRLSAKSRDEEIVVLLEELIDRPPRRIKLAQYNSFDDVIRLFKESKRILVLTGAGVSVSCGIPDFRSKDGIYARLHQSFPDLPDPSAMFDIHYFRRNPKPFYDFAKEIFPGAFEPSFSHKFIRHLEVKGQLLRNYTQNIDTLEKLAGIERVIECHGSFSSASCLECKAKYTAEDIRESVMNKKVAVCRAASCKGIIKPDIVFFGEGLHEDFHRQMALDRDEPDLLVVIGSSLKVRPVAMIPLSVPPSVPQILINRETIPHYVPDIELLGNCDDIIREIALSIGEEEFVLDYDVKRGRNIGQSTRRSRMIIRQDFDRIFDELQEEQERDMREAEEERSEEGEGVEGEDEPSAKKPRMESQSLKNFYSRRYINIESRLPEYSFFEVRNNQYVFRGAEMYMDMETRAVSLLPNIYSMSEDSSDDGCDHCGDDLDDGNPPSQPFSEPPRCCSPLPRQIRSSSCLPSLDTQSLLPPDIIRFNVENQMADSITDSLIHS